MTNISSPKYLNPPTLSQPPGYTQVVTISGGSTVYISGQLALNADGALVGKGDFEAQAGQVFRNLKSALLAVGGDITNIVKLTTFATDISRLPLFRKVRDSFIVPGPQTPASSFVQVVALAGPEFLIEIEAVAWLPEIRT